MLHVFCFRSTASVFFYGCNFLGLATAHVVLGLFRWFPTMPLLKKKFFPLSEPPKGLEPHEHVYQVHFTKEIFRDYLEYLNRINLYRQRLWTCKVSGKTNLTYEEALASEKDASEKVQEIPEEHATPALRMIQFSMLSLKDLSDKIAVKLMEHSLIGAEVHVRKGDDLCPCKILIFFDGDSSKSQYEVAWLDKHKKITGSGVVDGDDVTQKKFSVSRRVLKSFIRKSTYRNGPFVLHEKLAQKHGISSDPPQELKSKTFIQDGLFCNRKNTEGKKRSRDENSRKRKRKVEGEKAEENSGEEHDQLTNESVKYPIEDLLVQPGVDDPVFTYRPSPSRDFSIPPDCVGNLLMVWDFCTSYGRLLNLSPFSLEDFENAICHKGSSLSLTVETHSALLRLLIKNSNDDLLIVLKRNRKLKITLINWTEYLCDFLERTDLSDLTTCISTIKRGHYGLLDAQTKLGILQRLIEQAIQTDTVKEKLDEYIEQRQVLGATRREEALEEGRRKRQEKERVKTNGFANGVMNGHNVESTGRNLQSHVSNGNHNNQNGESTKKHKGEAVSSQLNNAPAAEIENNHSDSGKAGKNHHMNGGQEVKGFSKKEVLKLLRDAEKEPSERRNKDQRREYFECEMEKRVIRTDPLGKDRDYNRYWWFRRDGRIFVESSDSKLWGYYNSKEELDLLMGSLNHKGERERDLHKQLEKFYSRICSELQKRWKDIDDRTEMEETVHRRSSRVRDLPRENGFLSYVNKWKEE